MVRMVYVFSTHLTAYVFPKVPRAANVNNPTTDPIIARPMDGVEHNKENLGVGSATARNSIHDTDASLLKSASRFYLSQKPIVHGASPTRKQLIRANSSASSSAVRSSLDYRPTTPDSNSIFPASTASKGLKMKCLELEAVPTSSPSSETEDDSQDILPSRLKHPPLQPVVSAALHASNSQGTLFLLLNCTTLLNG